MDWEGTWLDLRWDAIQSIGYNYDYRMVKEIELADAIDDDIIT